MNTVVEVNLPAGEMLITLPASVNIHTAERIFKSVSLTLQCSGNPDVKAVGDSMWVGLKVNSET